MFPEDPNEDTAWIKRGSCVGATHLFFPGKSSSWKTAEAKRLCSTCPVRKQCLEYALKYSPTGVWGGTSGNDRSKIRAARGLTRGRSG